MNHDFRNLDTTRLADLAQWVTQNYDQLIYENKINMGSWYRLSKQEEQYQGCLMGWYAQNPTVQSQGLSLDKEFSTIFYETHQGREIDIHAVLAFFGLNHDQYDLIFTSGGYGSKKPHRDHILKHLNIVIAQKKYAAQMIYQFQLQKRK